MPRKVITWPLASTMRLPTTLSCPWQPTNVGAACKTWVVNKDDSRIGRLSSAGLKIFIAGRFLIGFIFPLRVSARIGSIGDLGEGYRKGSRESFILIKIIFYNNKFIHTFH